MARTVRQLLIDAQERLLRASHAPSVREARLLLGHVLGWPEARVLARDDAAVDEAAERRFAALISRRLGGEPVAYIFGMREFYGREFEVDRRVLIPRPETEHLIEAALELDLPPEPRILDIGSGSGCVAITLALERPDARVVATDVSPGALAVTVGNAHRLAEARRILAVRTHWARGVRLSEIDLVVSNPPYVAKNDPQLSREIADFEPAMALFAGADGLAAYRTLFSELVGLRSATPVLVEVGEGQAAAVVEEAESAGFVHRRTLDDYAGIPRIVVVNRQ